MLLPSSDRWAGVARRPLRRRRPVAGAVTEFAIAGLLAVVVVAAVGGLVLRRIGTDESIRDARLLADVVARGVLAPLITEDVLAGDGNALRRLDEQVRESVLNESIVRVKVWRPDGVVVYSDAASLIGKRYPLNESQRASFSDGSIDAGLSDLSRPENHFERENNELLEVYVPTRTADGSAVLVETYVRF